MYISSHMGNIKIPLEKFTAYALNEAVDKDKAIAFELALGYNINNADKLIANIMANLDRFPAIPKGNKGYGQLFEVVMTLTGENRKTANVLTGWIDDPLTGEITALRKGNATVTMTIRKAAQSRGQLLSIIH